MNFHIFSLPILWNLGKWPIFAAFEITRCRKFVIISILVQVMTITEYRRPVGVWQSGISTYFQYHFDVMWNETESRGFFSSKNTSVVISGTFFFYDMIPYSDSWNLFTWKEFSLFTRKANFHFRVNLLDYVDTIKRRGSEEDARNQVPQKLFTDKSAFMFFLRRTWLCFLLSLVVGMTAGVSWQASPCADFNSPPLKAITFRQQISCSCSEVRRLKFTDHCNACIISITGETTWDEYQFCISAGNN